MTFKLITLISALLLGAQSAAMDSVAIIDHNAGQQLPAEIPHTQVSIFGSTPRYSAFKHFLGLLAQQLKELDQSYEKNKRMKGVQKTIKQIILRFKEAHPEGSLAGCLEKLTLDVQFAIFFSFGVKTTTHKENIAALIACARAPHISQEIQQHTMIHLLLPIYFDDCAPYKPSLETIHAFLQAVAHFYRAQYEAIEKRPGCIIYIPPLKYFSTILEASRNGVIDKTFKDKLSTALLSTEIFSQIQSPEQLVIINPSGRGLKALGENLSREGISPKRMKLIELILMQGLERSKSFSPYVLKRTEELAQRISKTPPQLITQELLVYLTGGEQ